jgi:hypothetical protein
MGQPLERYLIELHSLRGVTHHRPEPADAVSGYAAFRSNVAAEMATVAANPTYGPCA